MRKLTDSEQFSLKCLGHELTYLEFLQWTGRKVDAFVLFASNPASAGRWLPDSPSELATYTTSRLRQCQDFLKNERILPITFLYTLDHVLIGPVPVRPLAVRHHLPADDAHRPHVARRGELAEGYGFGCRPSHWNLTTLEENVQ